MKKVTIIGATGYTGFELLRLLSTHDEVQIEEISSRTEGGKKLSTVFPSLKGFMPDIPFTNNEEISIKKADLYFLALPHGTSMDYAKALIDKGKMVVDLSADFRLNDKKVYEKWYAPHICPALIKDAAYGLTELNRNKIMNTDLVANPGCYPTSVILALTPLLKNHLIEIHHSIIIDSKSGTTGAGRKASSDFSVSEAANNFKAYGAFNHRHLPEITQELSRVADEDLDITFTPHLLPIPRGILSTMYVKLKPHTTEKEIAAAYKEAFGKEHFIRVLKAGNLPSLKNVVGSNFCDIGFAINENNDEAIIVSVIDNLIKGASGAAIQNMNLMLNIKETKGLSAAPMTL